MVSNITKEHKAYAWMIIIIIIITSSSSSSSTSSTSSSSSSSSSSGGHRQARHPEARLRARARRAVGRQQRQGYATEIYTPPPINVYRV